MRMRLPVWTPFAAVLVLACASSARAQGAPRPPAARAESAPKWRVEFHAGAAIAGSRAAGRDASLPPQSDPFLTTFGVASRAVPSWFFGDGAALFNQVNGQLGRSERIVPLDSVLTAGSARRSSGLVFGARLHRELTRRLGVEFGLDYAASGLAFDQSSLNQIETARASFVTAFKGMFSVSPALFGGSSVSASAQVTDKAGQRVFVTGSVDIGLGGTTRVHPYLVAGAAGAWSRGETPSAALTGNYRFTVPASTPFTINETDTLTIRYRASTAILGVFGGGVTRDLSPRTALQIDVRAFVGPEKVETVIDAAGSPQASSPIGAASTAGATASIQWSNDQSSARSTLSGRVQNYTTLGGAQVQTQVLVSVGYVIRF